MKQLPIGIDNFAEAVNHYYVDKTLLIKDLVDRAEGKSILLTRPRRFGKSLALSMVDYFFNCKVKSERLFKDKKIARAGLNYWAYLNAYPVVHLNMKGLEFSLLRNPIEAIKEKMSSLFRDYPELLSSTKLSDIDKQELQQIISKSANETLLADALRRLTRCLSLHYEKKVILLIDEYDAPLQLAYESGKFDEIMPLFKSLYGDALKSNDSLYFAFLTGVLQISKESLLSGLNNLDVASIDKKFLSPYFGFNQEEVNEMVHYYNFPVDYDQIRKYYGGYNRNNGQELCNPWSLINAIEEGRIAPYWTNTGENILLHKILRIENASSAILDFLNNPHKTAVFNPAISYKDINVNANASLSFLAQAGYLSLSLPQSIIGNTFEFIIPNEEIYNIFRTEIISRDIEDDQMDAALKLKNALLRGEKEEVSSVIQDYLLSAFSYFDFNDERNYHNALTGLLAVVFDRYIVKNEVATGTGRCDILLLPKSPNKVGILIEVKHSKSKSPISQPRLKESAQKGLVQIKNGDYIEILKKAECSSIYLYSIAFHRKTHAIVSDSIAM